MINSVLRIRIDHSGKRNTVHQLVTSRLGRQSPPGSPCGRAAVRGDIYTSRSADGRRDQLRGRVGKGALSSARLDLTVCNLQKQKVLLGKQASWAILEAIGVVQYPVIYSFTPLAQYCIMQDNTVIALSPITEAKSIKNDVEIEGFRQSHIRDGAALVTVLLPSSHIRS